MENEKELCKIVHKYEIDKHNSERTCVLSLTEGYFHINVLYVKVLRIISDNEILKTTIAEKFGITVYIEVDVRNPRCIIIFRVKSKIKHIFYYNCPPCSTTLYHILEDCNSFKHMLRFLDKTRRLINKMYVIRRICHKKRK